MSDTPRTDFECPVTICDRNGNEYAADLVRADFARELERENVKLRSIVRAAYLHCLDGCTPDGITEGRRLSTAEQHQLGKDLATYGCREANK